jgi:prepilin peptidase CpaA
VYQLAIFTVFPVAVIFAAFTDLFSMTIPNRISLFLVAGFLALAPFAPGMSLETFGWHVAAGALVLSVTFALFAFRVIGGGDAKLLAAVALWVGWEQLLLYVLLAGMAGGALAVGLLMFRAVPLPLRLAKESWLERLHRPRGDIPYGIALSAAALYIYPQTIWVASLVG